MKNHTDERIKQECLYSIHKALININIDTKKLYDNALIDEHELIDVNDLVVEILLTLNLMAKIK